MDILALRELQIFIAVAETSSMSMASSRLGLTQSAVSQSIRKLEDLLETELVDRSTRPITITAKGNALYDRARGLMAGVSELRSAITTPDSHILPRLRLGLVHSFAATVGPQLVHQFADMAKSWAITSGLSARHEQSLVMREVDILVVEGELDNLEGIERHAILAEPLVLVVPKAYKNSTKSLEEVNASLSLACYSHRSRTGQLITTALRQRNILSNQSFEFDETTAMLTLVGGGNHWAVTTPLCLMQATHLRSNIRICPLPGPVITRNLTLVGRQYELGTLPARLARSTGEILRKNYVPMVKTHMDWALGSIKTY